MSATKRSTLVRSFHAIIGMAANFDGRMSRLFSLVTLLLPFFVFNAFDVGEGLRTCEHVPPISINRGHDYPIWDNQGAYIVLALFNGGCLFCQRRAETLANLKERLEKDYNITAADIVYYGVNEMGQRDSQVDLQEKARNYYIIQDTG